MIEDFPEQLLEAVQIAKAAQIQAPVHTIQKILVAGMGGSGIGANYISEFVRKEIQASITVIKGYDIPAFVDENTLAICSSYSGNTEETIQCLTDLLKTEARIVCISSGGKLIEMAREHKLEMIILPGGYTSPRACLGFSLVAQLMVLEKVGLIAEQRITEVKKAAALLKREQAEIKNKAEKIAFLLYQKTPVIYTADQMEAVGLRFRQQLNENSKMLCWHHVIPELNHNELVGWRSNNQHLAVLFLRNSTDAPRVKLRMNITKEIVAHYTETVIEVFSKGESNIERSLYLTHLGDWISFYLADLRGFDVSEVKAIEFLKNELSNFDRSEKPEN